MELRLLHVAHLEADEPAVVHAQRPALEVLEAGIVDEQHPAELAILFDLRREAVAATVAALAQDQLEDLAAVGLEGERVGLVLQPEVLELLGVADWADD